MRSMFLTIVFLSFFSQSGYCQQTVVIQPGATEGKDSYINSAFPEDSWGTSPNLIACAWTFGGEFGIGRSLIRFDLSQIPPDAEILDARLTLYFNPNAGFGEQTGENASYLKKITEDWSEMTVTWNSQPQSTDAGAVFLPATQSPSQDLSDVNITGFVAGWVLHPETNFGFIHRMETEIEYCCLALSSSDQVNPAKRPKLVVTYRVCNPPVAGFSFVVQIPRVIFSDTSTSASSWFWDFGDGYFSNLKNPEHSYSGQSIYKVCLAVSDSCGSDTVCKNVTVCEMPEPHFHYAAKSQMVSFHDSSSMPQSWYWDFGDGFYSDLKDPVHYFNKPGSYYVCEKVTNACSVQTFCDSVKIIPDAIDEQSGRNELILYPNPAHDMLFLMLTVHTGSVMAVELCTPQGISIKSWVQLINPGNVPIPLNIEGLSKGLYVLQTKIDGVIRLNKLIIL